jgi:hypothetical protein
VTSWGHMLLSRPYSTTWATNPGGPMRAARTGTNREGCGIARNQKWFGVAEAVAGGAKKLPTSWLCEEGELHSWQGGVPTHAPKPQEWCNG